MTGFILACCAWSCSCSDIGLEVAGLTEIVGFWGLATGLGLDGLTPPEGGAAGAL